MPQPDALILSLVQARKQAQMTQAQLAERAGLSRMAVQRTETGDVDPRFSTLLHMAQVLNLELIAVPAGSVAEVLPFLQTGSEHPGPKVDVDPPGAPDEQR